MTGLAGSALVAVLHVRGLSSIDKPSDLVVPMGFDAVVDTKTSPILAALAHSTTIFHLLWFGLIVIGLPRVTSLSRRTSVSIALAMWMSVIITGSFVLSCSPSPLTALRVGKEQCRVARDQPVVTVRNLSVAYDGFTLHPLSFDLYPGDRLALVGPNGAGKSTLLGVLGGLNSAYAGQVLLDGVDLAEALPGIRARIGLLPESPLGFGWMTVAQHLQFLSAFYPTWSAPYCRALLERLALPTDAKVGTLSKGMRVKLAFIAAESFRPPLLLLDEPTSGLDPVVRREFIDVVRSTLAADPARIVVFSTHILEDVEWMADRVLVIDDGRMKANTTISEVSSKHPGESLVRALYAMLERTNG